MFNIVFIMDLSRPASLHFITNTISMLISRSYPVRVGVVPIVGTEEGAKMARVFYYLTQNYGRLPTMRFFGAVREPPFQLTPSLIILYQVLELMGGIKPELDWSIMQARFESLASDEYQKRGRSDVIRCSDRRHLRSFRREDHQGTRIHTTAGCRRRLVLQRPLIYQRKIFPT